tara:strand:- start:1152 stop:2291 length:1140 start_codon:yes stop_codon:yes gene_type:complete
MLFSFLWDISYILYTKFKYSINIISEDDYNNEIIKFIMINGVIFIKFTQIITSGSGKKSKNAFGTSLFNKMIHLQDKCYQNIYNIIPYIDYIDKNPIASGSIAQIYKINYNNNIAVLKILLPNINYNIANSIQKLKKLKSFIYYMNYPLYQIIEMYDLEEYLEYIEKQTNLYDETINTMKFKSIFSNTNKIIIPDIYYKDNSKIIMSYERGIKLIDLKKKYPEYYQEALYLMISFMYVSINNNILHGDFHLGNFLFRLEKDILKMIVLDYGIVVPINDDFKNLFISCFDFSISDEEMIDTTMEIFKLININPKIRLDLFNLDTKNKNIFDFFDVNNTKIPIKYISLSFFFPTMNELIKNLNKTSFMIKFMNYMYKNKLL